MLVRQSLDAPEKSFLAVNWRVKNASITEFTFSRDRLSLDRFHPADEGYALIARRIADSF